jgi:integrase
MVQATNLHPLTLDEVKRLLAAASGHPDEVLLIVALALGLRRGELLALHWSDIDFANGILSVHCTLHPPDREAEPKTGRREILLPDFLIEVFRQHRLHQDEAKQEAGMQWQEHDLVFANPSGGFLEPTRLSLSFREIGEVAGVVSGTFHRLRCTTTALLLSLGVPPQVVQDILGIRNVSSALLRTEQPLRIARQDAMAKLDDLFRTLFPTDHPDPSALDVL